MDDFCHQICFLQNQEGFLTMFCHNCPHSRFHREWSDCQHRGSPWPQTPLQKRFDFYWPCVDIWGIYFSLAFLHTLTLPSQYARLNLDSSEKSKQDLLSGTVQLRVLLHHRCRRSRFSRLRPVFLYSYKAVNCLTMEPSLDNSFRNWMSKVCKKLLCDLSQWAFWALILDCSLLWTTITWQSLPSTSFPIPFSNPPPPIIFRCRSDDIACVNDISFCNTTSAWIKRNLYFTAL